MFWKLYVFSHCLPPDRAWHKVNDPKADYNVLKIVYSYRQMPFKNVLLYNKYIKIDWGPNYHLNVFEIYLNKILFEYIYYWYLPEIEPTDLTN